MEGAAAGEFGRLARSPWLWGYLLLYAFVLVTLHRALPPSWRSSAPA
jgi:hypothetical protein